MSFCCVDIYPHTYKSQTLFPGSSSGPDRFGPLLQSCRAMLPHLSRSSPLWWCNSLKLSAALAVVGSLLSSLPWPLRLPLPLWGLLSVRRHHHSPTPLKGLSLISMPLGLLHRLLPNKHTAKIFFNVSSTLHVVLTRLSPTRLPPFLFFAVFCSPLPALSLCSWSSHVEGFRGFMLLPLRPSVSSGVCISPEDILSPCVGNVELLYLPVSFFYVSQKPPDGEETAVRGC